MTWTLLILWTNGFLTEFTGIESEEDCQAINALLRQQIYQLDKLNPHYACMLDDSQK